MVRLHQVSTRDILTFVHIPSSMVLVHGDSTLMQLYQAITVSSLNLLKFSYAMLFSLTEAALVHHTTFYVKYVSHRYLPYSRHFDVF